MKKHICKKALSNHGTSRQCPSHGEQLTMFCTTSKTMHCMKCFSESSLETRLHCIDIDIAYDQGKKKLERALRVRREFNGVPLWALEGVNFGAAL